MNKVSEIALFYGALFLFLTVLLLIAYYFQTNTIEPFENASASSEDAKAIEYIQKLNGILTEPYKKTLKSFTDTQEGVADIEKPKKGLEAMNADCKLLFKDVPGTSSVNLLELPLPENLLELPADIDVRLVTTITYLTTKTSQMLKDIENSLSCKEGFNSTLTPEEKRKCCSDPELNYKPEEVKQIQYSRRQQIETIMANQDIQKSLATLSDTFNKLQDIQKKMEEGSIKPACGGF